MEKTDNKVPAYAWINLLGLEIPIAAVCWSILFCEIIDIHTVPSNINQFLFVAAWCATMGTRLFHIFKNPKLHDLSPELQFAKSNWIILSFLTGMAVLCGLWMILFQLGIGIFSYALLPFSFCMLYFYRGKLIRQGITGHIYGALAFASAAPIPAFFYSPANQIVFPPYIPNPQSLFYPPFWALAGLTCLISLCRTSFFDEEAPTTNRIRTTIPILTGVLFFFIISEMMRLKTESPEFWYFTAIGAGTALLYYIDQIKHRFSTEAFLVTSWVALIIPVPFALLMIRSPI